MRDRRLTRIAGLVLVRQKPGSAKGVMFITIEDETGVANLVIWPSLYEQRRRVVLSSSLLIVDGKVQREGEVVHIVATKLHDGSDLLASVGEFGGRTASMVFGCRFWFQFWGWFHFGPPKKSKSPSQGAWYLSQKTPHDCQPASFSGRMNYLWQG